MNFEINRAKFNRFAEKFGVLLITLFPILLINTRNGVATIYSLLSLLSLIYLLLNFKDISLFIKKIPKPLLLAFLI
jgi:hypothetical protein